jgi:Protein of unknown function (DUF2971)
MEEADRLMRRAAKVACFTLDYELPESALDQNALRGYAHPALWAHYGGAHAGVCLRFSYRALADRIQAVLGPRGQVFHGPVDYGWDPGRISRALDLEQVNEFGLDAVVVEFIRVHHRELFFSKHQDWSSEHEYRWVLVEPGPLPAYVDVAECVTGIVLGDGFPTERLDAVHELAERCGGLDIKQVKFHNAWMHVMPVTRAPRSSRAPKASRRSGTLEERVQALAKAETDAAEAQARGERFAAPLVAEIQAVIEQIATRAQTLTAVDVVVTPQTIAVPPPQRRRAPGVPTIGPEYERGITCIVESLPRYGVTLVVAAAVQTLVDARVKLHASCELERRPPTGNERQELWRFEREAGLDVGDAKRVTAELLAAMLDAVDEALAAFEHHRCPGDSPVAKGEQS